MIIEVEDRDEQYALDVVNVILCDLKLEEDPRFKVRNYRLRYIIYGMITVACFVLAVLFAISYKSIIVGICAGVFGFCAMFAFGYVRSSGMIMKQLLKKGRTTYTFSKEGIEYDNHNMQKVTYQWDYFRYIKLYGTGMFFIPKKKASPILAIPVRYENEIMNYMKDNGILLDEFT